MSRSIPAFVKPSLLIWAREKAGLSISTAAEKSGTTPEILLAWERGENQPTIAQLRKLGAIYKRPLAVFFLPMPPHDFDAQREFRRLPGLSPQNETSELRQALRTALYRREAARTVYDRLGEPIPTLSLSLDPTDDEDSVSTRVRALLNMSWEDQLNCAGPYAVLDAWRSAIELQGVLVFQTGGVDINEMRGISIPEGPLPVILLNNADAPLGRVFTLLHEFIHLLFTNAGHHTSKLEGKKLPEDQLLERVSNRFAAAVLMPKQEFLSEVINYPGAATGDTESLNRFARSINVSPEAILRRLVTLHRARASVYKQKRRDWQRFSSTTKTQSSGGPPPEVKIVASTGRTFASLVINGYRRNAVSSADVVDYLGIQLKYLHKVADQLLSKPGMEGAH